MLAINVNLSTLIVWVTVFWSICALISWENGWIWTFWILNASYIWTLCIMVSVTVGFVFARKLLLICLGIASAMIKPILMFLQLVPLLRRATEIMLMIYFFMWFRGLLFFDRGIRIFLRLLRQNRHPTGHMLSIVNSCDPKFEPLATFEEEGDSSSSGYNEDVAISMGNIARLAYEDRRVIAYELERAGFNPESIKFINYRNTCGFVARKQRHIAVSFRGTDPLNLMSLYTDSKLGTVALSTLDYLDEEGKREEAVISGVKDESGLGMGKVHYGFAEAMRLSPTNDALNRNRRVRDEQQQEEHPQHVDGHMDDKNSDGGDSMGDDDFTTITLSNQTFLESLKTAFFGFFKILQFAWMSLLLHSSDPIDTSFTGRGERKVTAYDQAVRAIDSLFEAGMDVYISGHSLGGALSIIFLAQAAHEQKAWLKDTWLYTYGAPRVGDEGFADFMRPYRFRMVHVVNNNDIVARIPWQKREIGYLVPWLPLSVPGSSGQYERYHDNEGVLVFIDGSSGRVLVDPPALRGILFTKLSGTLNPQILLRMRNENAVRIAFRLIAPFFLNDHIPCDYVQMLKSHRLLYGNTSPKR